MHPDERAVFAYVALVELVRLALTLPEVPVVFHADCQVVRMRHVLEAECEHFLAGIAKHVAELLVDIEPAPIEGGVPNPNGGMLEGSAEVRFAGAAGFFQFFALADVDADPHPFSDIAPCIQERNAPYQEGAIE